MQGFYLIAPICTSKLMARLSMYSKDANMHICQRCQYIWVVTEINKDRGKCLIGTQRNTNSTETDMNSTGN